MTDEEKIKLCDELRMVDLHGLIKSLQWQVKELRLALAATPCHCNHSMLINMKCPRCEVLEIV